MAKQKVAILGCSGMLGSMMLDYLARYSAFDLVATARSAQVLSRLRNSYRNVEFYSLDAKKATPSDLIQHIKSANWVFNAIGIIKPHISEDNAAEIHNAILINSHFPHILAQAAQKTGSKVLQIATDCVFSGKKGGYNESKVHDPIDVYGKSKSLGEVRDKNFHNLRCSIVGPELKGHKSLLNWFLSQDQGTKINGFINHQWNGLSTLHFAKICEGIAKKDIQLPNVHHIVPANSIIKADLLRNFAREFNREDIIINDFEADRMINSTLTTNNENTNHQIWRAAGYNKPPTVQRMVKELAQYEFPQKVLG